MRLILMITTVYPTTPLSTLFFRRLPANTMDALPLSELAPATVARIEELQVYSEDATRLRAMGICVGRQVQLMRAGDPLILRVLGARVGVSARLAAGVGVVPVA